MKSPKGCRPVKVSIDGIGAFDGFIPIEEARFAGVLFDKAEACKVSAIVNELNGCSCMRYDPESDSFTEDVDGRLLAYRADERGLYPIGPDWLWANVPPDQRESHSELKEAAGNEAIERSSLTEFRENGIR